MAAKPPKPPTTNNFYDNNNHQNHNIRKSNVTISPFKSKTLGITTVTNSTIATSTDIKTGSTLIDKITTVTASSLSSSSTSSSLATSPEIEENLININNSNIKSVIDNNVSINNINSDCPCTNISIMQLFHEMKQEFPTVPDHIVNQCVIDNCHDRETCIENLKRELASHPNTVQAYPAQILRNHHQNQIQHQQQQQKQNQHQQENSNSKVLLKPTRPAPVPLKSNLKYNKNLINNLYNNSDNKKIKCDFNDNKSNSKSSLPPVIGDSLSYNNGNDLQNKQQKLLNKGTCEYVQEQKEHPQRPTTLSFRELRSQKESFQSQQKSIIHKPVRRAPLPPTCNKQSSQQQHQPHLCQQNTSPLQQQSIQCATHLPDGYSKNDQSYSSPSIQSPLSFSDSGESEISVNISLSPSSDISRGPNVGNVGCRPSSIKRRTTSITVTPEPPYTRDFIQSQNPRCYTSLNLTLRKPGTTPQSPIDISAGPGLTYSSTSFDSRRGYQKNFHITVTDKGGTFTASQIRPRTIASKTQHNNVLPTIYPESEIYNENINSPQTPPQQHPYRIHPDDIPISPPSYTSDNYFEGLSPQDNATTGIIQRQKSRKDALARSLQKNKQKLERVQNEIKILKLPVIPGESERLDSEIERLRCDCENILQEIEITKRNETDYYDNENILQRAAGAARQRLTQYQEQYQPHMPYHLYHPPPVSGQYHYDSYNQQQQRYNQYSNNQNNYRYKYQNSVTPSAPPDDNLAITAGVRSSRPITTTTTVMMNQQELHTNLHNHQNDFINETNSDGDSPWTCSMCTFQNHPLLNKCECCENVREISGTTNNTSNNIEVDSINTCSPAIIDNHNNDVYLPSSTNSIMPYCFNYDNINNFSRQCQEQEQEQQTVLFNLPTIGAITTTNAATFQNFNSNYTINRNDNDIAAHFLYLPWHDNSNDFDNNEINSNNNNNNNININDNSNISTTDNESNINNSNNKRELTAAAHLIT